MSVAECAELVRRRDPDRFLATMAAPAAARALLWPLYAFNLEVARAPWVTAEAMIAEMRLQWWRDVVADSAAGSAAGQASRAHEVAGPLAGVIAGQGLPVALFDAMILARRWDITRAPFADAAAFAAHIDATAGHLMWLAALCLGAGRQAEPVVRDFAFGAGVAAWLCAVPELEARGRLPLPDGRPVAVAALAELGLERIARARASRGLVPAETAPALLTGWQATGLLRQAAAEPARVANGTLGLPEIARRGGLMWRGLTGRW